MTKLLRLFFSTFNVNKRLFLILARISTGLRPWPPHQQALPAQSAASIGHNIKDGISQPERPLFRVWKVAFWGAKGHLLQHGSLQADCQAVTKTQRRHGSSRGGIAANWRKTTFNLSATSQHSISAPTSSAHPLEHAFILSANASKCVDYILHWWKLMSVFIGNNCYNTNIPAKSVSFSCKRRYFNRNILKISGLWVLYKE